MKPINQKKFRLTPLRSVLMIGFLGLSAAALSTALNVKQENNILAATSIENEEPFILAATSDIDAAKDSIESVRAFAKVYRVLMSPRCMNCHPSGDSPLQGDNNVVHTMNPRRGKDGKGIYAMKCANCHQEANVPGKHTPPGNPNWHLPPADMKMVFQGKSLSQLAKQLVNPKTNGNKTMQQLLDHAKDTLVVAGWNPGEGRTLPPINYSEFSEAWSTWIKKGAYAPK